MKKILVAALIMSSTTVFANEAGDVLVDVKTPTKLTVALGKIKIGQGAPQESTCVSNEAYNSSACVTGSTEFVQAVAAVLAKLGLKGHDVSAPDAGQDAGGN